MSLQEQLVQAQLRVNSIKQAIEQEAVEQKKRERDLELSRDNLMKRVLNNYKTINIIGVNRTHCRVSNLHFEVIFEKTEIPHTGREWDFICEIKKTYVPCEVQFGDIPLSAISPDNSTEFIPAIPTILLGDYITFKLGEVTTTTYKSTTGY